MAPFQIGRVDGRSRVFLRDFLGDFFLVADFAMLTPGCTGRRLADLKYNRKAYTTAAQAERRKTFHRLAVLLRASDNGYSPCLADGIFMKLTSAGGLLPCPRSETKNFVFLSVAKSPENKLIAVDGDKLDPMSLRNRCND